MTYIRTVALVLVAFVLLNNATSSRIAGSRFHPSQSPVSTVGGQLSDRVRAEVSAMRAGLRADAQALLQAVDTQEKRRLIEKLGDSDSDSVRDLFADLVTTETVASVRLDLINYLIRNPRPDLQPIFARLAASDPDPDVAVAALEGVRAIEVLKVREVLDQRLNQSKSDPKSFETFADADERWISLVRGTMLPGFLRVPPPLFTVTNQNNVRVVAFGDFGTGSDAQKEVAAAIQAHHRQSPFDIGITVGDNFYPMGMESLKDPRWQTWWEDLYAPLKIPFYAVLGNHDWYKFDSPAAEILYSGKTPSWNMPAPYYTFIAGPIQFFAVDTQKLSAKQLAWLDSEITKSRSTWKVVYGHHQIYSDGYHGDNPRMIEQLLPLLKNRVDIYLCGHEHDMQHLKPEAGIQFLISGGGGRDLRTPQPSDRALFAQEVHGFTILEATPAKLDIRFIGADSKTLHQYTLQKTVARNQ